MFFLKKRSGGDNDFGWWLAGFEPEGENRDDEVIPGEEPACGPSSRSYTPERLVRDQDYSILSSPGSPSGEGSPIRRRRRRLSRFIDKRLVGASQLEALLDPEPVDVRIPAVLRRKLSAQGRLKESRSYGDILALANLESPQRLVTPDLMSSGSSCERLGGDREVDRIEEVDFEPEGGNREGEPSAVQVLVTDIGDDPEIEVRNLRGRIEIIRETNKDIFQDVSLLRKGFQWAEMKTGNLTTETSRLRREIRELRYLDDLVNLLKGELERISQRNWPFTLGHAEHHAEEVNLVV